MLEVSSNISAYRVITMSDRKALELSLNGISPFKRGEGSTRQNTVFPLLTVTTPELTDLKPAK